MHPVEHLWKPDGDAASGSGIIAHHGLYVTGLDDLDRACQGAGATFRTPYYRHC